MGWCIGQMCGKAARPIFSVASVLVPFGPLLCDAQTPNFTIILLNSMISEIPNNIFVDLLAQLRHQEPLVAGSRRRGAGCHCDIS